MLRHTRNRNREARLIALLALFTCLMPVIAIHSAYIVAAAFETVPLCFPYLDGCTSISSTGRTLPSVWLFKPVMLVSAVTMAIFFLKSARYTGGSITAGQDALALLGLAASAALVMYIIFLGTEGQVYRLLRRYGVTLYFGFTYLAQLLLARRLIGASDPHAAALARWMVSACVLLLIIGIASVPISNFVPDKDQIENVIEWNFALLMQLNFLFAWRAFSHLYTSGSTNAEI